MRKIIVLSLSIFGIISSLNAKVDLKEVFLSLPDSIFISSSAYYENVFVEDIRKTIIDDKFINENSKWYKANIEEIEAGERIIHEGYNPIDTYQVLFNERASFIECRYYNFSMWQELYIYVEEVSNVELHLYFFENINYEMGIEPKLNNFFAWNYNVENSTYIPLEIELDKIDWSDFYSEEDFKKLDIDLLSEMSIPLDYKLYDIEGTAVLSISADVEFVIEMLRYIVQSDGIFYDDEDLFSITSDTLGFTGLPEPKKLYYHCPNLKQLDTYNTDLILSYLNLRDNSEFNLVPRQLKFDNEVFEWSLMYDDFGAKLIFEDDKMTISENASGDYKETYCICENSLGRYLLITKNLTGFNNTSEFNCYSLIGTTIMWQLESVFEKEFTNKDFGVDYSENIFKKFPDAFILHYELEDDYVTISIEVNPIDINEENESIAEQLIDSKKVLKIKFSEILD